MCVNPMVESIIIYNALELSSTPLGQTVSLVIRAPLPIAPLYPPTLVVPLWLCDTRDSSLRESESDSR